MATTPTLSHTSLRSIAVLGYALLDAAIVPFVDRHLREAEVVARRCLEALLAPSGR